MAAVSAAIVWVLLDWLLIRRPTLRGLTTGAITGLVAITPAAGFVSIGGAIAIGIGASLLVYVPVAIAKEKFGFDDALNVFSVHGLGGMWGTFATGLWATKSANANAAATGLFYGNAIQLAIQLKAILATTIYAFVVSYLLLKLLDVLIGLRVSEQSEQSGLDLSQQRESAYPS
jgi:Amt family ammonium transporter